MSYWVLPSFFLLFFFWPTELMAGFGVALRAGPAVADWLRESRRRLAALFDDEKKKMEESKMFRIACLLLFLQ